MNHVAIPRKCFYLCVRCKYRLLFMHELFVFALAVILIFGQWTRFDGGTEIASIVSNFAAQIKAADHKYVTNARIGMAYEIALQKRTGNVVPSQSNRFGN